MNVTHTPLVIAFVSLLFSCGIASSSSSSSSGSVSSSSVISSSSLSNTNTSSAPTRPALDEVDPSLFSYIAHRGYHDETNPENSLAAFRAATDLGLAIETDVHLSKDKHLVISHDSSLPGFGSIESNTISDIQNGYSLSNGEKIPSFADMIKEIPDEKMIVLELKVPDGSEGAPIAKALMEETKDLDLAKKMVVISFNLEALNALSSSSFNRGLLVSGDYNLDIFKAKSKESITTSFCEFYSLAYTLLNSEESVSYRSQGGKITGWTFKSQSSVDSFKTICDGYTFEGFLPSI